MGPAPGIPLPQTEVSTVVGERGEIEYSCRRILKSGLQNHIGFVSGIEISGSVFLRKSGRPARFSLSLTVSSRPRAP